MVGGSLAVIADGAQINSLRSGDCFGEMGILNSAPRSATVAAQSAASVLVLPATDLRAMLAKSAALRQGLRAVASEREGALRRSTAQAQRVEPAGAGAELSTAA